MHAFNPRGVIHKYNTPNEILSEFCMVRLDMYETRRTTILETLKYRIPYHENVVRFIQQQCLDKPLPDLRRKTPEECDTLLENDKFVKIDSSYNYLLNLPIASLTLKHTKKHEQDLADLRKEIEVLEKTTAKQMWKSELMKVSLAD